MKVIVETDVEFTKKVDMKTLEDFLSNAIYDELRMYDDCAVIIEPKVRFSYTLGEVKL